MSSDSRWIRAGASNAVPLTVTGACLSSLAIHAALIAGLVYFTSSQEQALSPPRDLRIDLSPAPIPAVVVSTSPPTGKSGRSEGSIAPSGERHPVKHASVKTPPPPTPAVDNDIAATTKQPVQPESSTTDQGSQEQLRSIDLRVLDWLARYRSYPLAARRARIEGVVHVRAVLMPDGRLLDARIEQSSGNALLDGAALDLLVRASPLPASFGSARTEQIQLRLPIIYRMRTSST